jgi:hypothetical protein
MNRIEILNHCAKMWVGDSEFADVRPVVILLFVAKTSLSGRTPSAKTMGEFSGKIYEEMRRRRLPTVEKYSPEMWIMMDEAIKSPDRRCDEAQQLYEEYLRNFVECQARQAKGKRSSAFLELHQPPFGGRS